MNPIKIQFYGDYSMRLLDIIQPYLAEGADLQSVLSEVDLSLVMEESLSHGYGSFTDRTVTATLQVRYQGEVIHEQEEYDITSQDSSMF